MGFGKHRSRRLARSAAIVGLVSLLLICGAQTVFPLGENGGIRLILHVVEADIPPGAAITEDPCLSPPALESAQDAIVDYAGESDTVMVWVYLHHPREMGVRGLGFGIEYAGIDVITSGSCAPRIYQDNASMGKWADSGSEMAFAWGLEDYPRGQLAPVSWFILERLDRDGFFRVTKGKTPMAGSVGDTNMPPKGDPFWGYGMIGFGETMGELPTVAPEEIPKSWGAVGVSAR